MSERFFKYHGLGNDFVVLDRRASGLDLTPSQARHWCDRHRGVGADGVLVLLPAAAAAARMVVHNPDGSIAEMCGNGLRCAVKYLVEHAAERATRVSVVTGAGTLESEVHWNDNQAVEFTVDMGPAQLVSRLLPSGTSGDPFVDAPIPGFAGLRGTAVSMGNPHLVLLGQPLEDGPLLGPRLEYAEGFPERTNVEFVQPLSVGLEQGLEVVVWERGAGLTEACGTGACAAAAAAVHQQQLPADTFLPVRLPGGPLSIRVRRDLGKVWMRGPAVFLFEALVPAWAGH